MIGRPRREQRTPPAAATLDAPAPVVDHALANRIAALEAGQRAKTAQIPVVSTGEWVAGLFAAQDQGRVEDAERRVADLTRQVERSAAAAGLHRVAKAAVPEPTDIFEALSWWRSVESMVAGLSAIPSRCEARRAEISAQTCRHCNQPLSATHDALLADLAAQEKHLVEQLAKMGWTR
jgi:hypothetical protein